MSSSVSPPTIDLKLYPKQSLVFLSDATEIMYGGAAGGGKSHLLRVLLISICLQVPGIQCYLFRRRYDDLLRNHWRGPTGFRSLLDKLIKAKHCVIIKREVRFSNGSAILGCHCRNEDDVENYQGAEIHCLAVEEAGQFTEYQLRYLRGRVRLSEEIKNKLPDMLKKQLPRIILTANPGGACHDYLKKQFVRAVDPMTVWQTPKSEGGFKRQYIPARLDDNPSLDKEQYEANLSGLGSEALVRALRDGDWDAVQGAYFSEFGDRHIVKPYDIPNHWQRYVGFDWGHHSPFAVVWGAVSSGKLDDGSEAKAAKGSIVIYREWYGCTDRVTEGMGLSNPEMAKGILERMTKEERESVLRWVADPSIFKEDGGPSIAEQLHKCGVSFLPADNSRVAGWQEVRQRLRNQPRPMLTFFSTCRHMIDIFPTLQHDEKKPEDLDSTGPDHLFDALRYLCMARPFTSDYREPDKVRSLSEIPIGEVIKSFKRHGRRTRERQR